MGDQLGGLQHRVGAVARRQHPEDRRQVHLDRAFGEAGTRVVLEECLTGPEVSYFVIADGARCQPLVTAQDHKRLFDDDRGPNTGGMGAFAPSPLVDDALEDRILREIIEPVLGGMAAEGMPFTGFLYCGLMLTPDGPRVIEFNVRFGDPETQPIMLRLQSDLVDLIEAALQGRLDQVEARWDPRPAIGVVIAAQGYPGKVRGGDPIHGLDAEPIPDTHLFHAGTRLADGRAVSAGGRVLTACALGDDIGQARDRAYTLARAVGFDGSFFRRDIGHRALARQG